MPKKAFKLRKVQTYLSDDTLLQCKADAVALRMTLSEYVATVLGARLGKWTLPPPVPPSELAARSRGTARLSRGIGDTSADVDADAEEGKIWVCGACWIANTEARCAQCGAQRPSE
jgi:hypothetical protein